MKNQVVVKNGNNEIAVAYGLNDIKEMGKIIAQSGLFGVKSPDQAVALMLIAQAEGKHPAMAAQEYNIIQGRPALKADAMLARFQQAGGKVRWVRYTDSEVSAIFSHPQGGEVEVSWTLERARKAGLTGKDNWQKYPRQMLKARVISEGVRLTYPAIAVGVYTPEEVIDFDEPIEAQEVSVQPVQEPAVHKEPNAEPEAVEAEMVDEAPSQVDSERATFEALGIELEEKNGWIKAVEKTKGALYQNRNLLKEHGFKFNGEKKIWVKKVA